MPSLDLYKKQYGTGTVGQVHKKQSDMIMNATWWNDIQSRVAYLYDYYHDDNPTKLRNLNSPKDKKKIPVEIKYVQHTKQTMDKDNITFHLQFRPGAKCEVPYYEDYVKMYNLEYPLGLYVDIPDESGVFNRWLIVAKANAYSAQFIDYEILPCDYTIQYIFNNEKYQVASVLRSQNSSIRRFIRETLCQKFSNCRNSLRVNMLQRKIEISKRDRFKKLLNWETRSEVPNRKTFNDQVLK